MNNRIGPSILHSRLPVRLVVAGLVILLMSASIALAADGPSDYPPPPPTPLAPCDWEGPLTPFVGDSNLDTRVTMADVLAIMQHRAGIALLCDSGLAVSDTNNDGQVTMADCLHIMQFRADEQGTLGILLTPLWVWPDDAGLSDPLGQNAG